MQNHRRGRTLHDCGLTTQRGQPNSEGPFRWGRLASVSKTRQNLSSRRCSTENWVFRCVNSSSNLLSNRTVIYPANLLSRRQTQPSIQAVAEDGGGGEDRLAPACVQADTHARMCVWQWENSYTHSEGFIPDFFSWKSPPLIFSFGYIKLGILKAWGFFCCCCFFSLNWVLFWICFKMNVAFIPITGS